MCCWFPPDNFHPCGYNRIEKDQKGHQIPTPPNPVRQGSLSEAAFQELGPLLRSLCTCATARRRRRGAALSRMRLSRACCWATPQHSQKPHSNLQVLVGFGCKHIIFLWTQAISADTAVVLFADKSRISSQLVVIICRRTCLNMRHRVITEDPHQIRQNDVTAGSMLKSEPLNLNASIRKSKTLLTCTKPAKTCRESWETSRGE